MTSAEQSNSKFSFPIGELLVHKAKRPWDRSLATHLLILRNSPPKFKSCTMSRSEEGPATPLPEAPPTPLPPTASEACWVLATECSCRKGHLCRESAASLRLVCEEEGTGWDGEALLKKTESKQLMFTVTDQWTKKNKYKQKRKREKKRMSIILLY